MSNHLTLLIFFSPNEATVNHFLLFWACICSAAGSWALFVSLSQSLVLKWQVAMVETDRMRHRRKFCSSLGAVWRQPSYKHLCSFCHFRCEWVVAISKMYLRHYLISTTFSHHRPPTTWKSPRVLGQDHADFYGLLTWIIKGEKSFLLCLCLLVVPVKGSSLVMEAMLKWASAVAA